MPDTLRWLYDKGLLTWEDAEDKFFGDFDHMWADVPTTHRNTIAAAADVFIDTLRAAVAAGAEPNIKAANDAGKV